jgi:DNA-binding MarR family transcriptional regulator
MGVNLAKSRKVSELDDHVGYWLRFVSNHVSQGFARKAEELGATVAEWVLLRTLLDAGPAAPSRLAEAMGATRGTVTKLADRLIDKDLVARLPDPADGRAQILNLTTAGRALVPKLAAAADRNDAECFGHLSTEERADLVRILRGVVERGGLRTLPVD